MGNYSSADEILAESVAKMGSPLGEIYYELSNQTTLLHIRWHEYRRLFADSEAAIAIMNKTAPAFFYDIERIMWENVILQLCRITDPERMGKHEHLTIQRLPSLVSDLVFRNTLQNLVDSVVSKAAFARDWRNRKLAHSELPPLPGQVATPLADASRKHVEDALASLRDVMNCLEQQLRGCPVAYQHAIEPLGGVHSLLAILREGYEARKQDFRSKGVELP
jgi:hypothetical protein